ncbi:unnamed protein product [Cochlearia groenlandica]
MNSSAFPRSFADIDGEFCCQEIFVRLIHFREARNFKRGNALTGFELLFIDAKFMLSPAKALYRVSSNDKSVTFTNQTTMEIEVRVTTIPTHSFRLRLYADLAAIADQNRDLLDVIGHIRYIDGDDLQKALTIIPAQELPLGNLRTRRNRSCQPMAKNRRHLSESVERTSSASFCQSGHYHQSQDNGAVTIGSTSSTRLFFDNDVKETKQFIAKFPMGAPNVVATVSSSAITKLETVTIAEITQFLQTETLMSAGFYCFATVTEVRLNGWNYISCTGCKSKMEELGTSMVCTNRKCTKPINVGLIRYRFEVSVRDATGTTTFVIFDDAAKKLLAKTVVKIMMEITEVCANCRTCKFQIKVTPYSFTAIRQTFTVSRIVEDNIIDEAPVNPPEEAYDNIVDRNVQVELNDNIPVVSVMQTPPNGASGNFETSPDQPVDVASASTFKEPAEKKLKLV